jgi:hypothetical protein
VKIIDQPYKVGIAKNKIYLEVHPPLEENIGGDARQQIQTLIYSIIGQNRIAFLDWSLIEELISAQHGVPQVVGELQ